jgi:hypothetical protein
VPCGGPCCAGLAPISATSCVYVVRLADLVWVGPRRSPWLGGLIALWGLAVVFAKLLGQRGGGDGITRVDRPLSGWLAAHREHGLTLATRTLTELGSPVGVTVTNWAGGAHGVAAGVRRFCTFGISARLSGWPRLPVRGSSGDFRHYGPPLEGITVSTLRQGQSRRCSVISPKILRYAAVGLGAVAVPVVIGVVGAAPSSADPGLCVSGPYGYAQACVDLPGWYGGPYWGGGWDNGWDSGWHHGDGQGEDD